MPRPWPRTTVSRRSARRRRRAPAAGWAASHHARAQEVVDIKRAEHVLRIVHHHERSDAELLHDVYGLGREFVGAYRLAMRSHHLAHGRRVQIEPEVERAA